MARWACRFSVSASISPVVVSRDAVSADTRARAAEVGATVVREGIDFGIAARNPAVGGQVVSLQGLRAHYDEVFLPLYGAHQAENAALALAAVEAFLGGGETIDGDLVRAAFAEVTSPGRLEIVRQGPTILLDAAHNPHGAEATAAALEDSFTLDPVIGVIGVMGDKDAEGPGLTPAEAGGKGVPAVAKLLGHFPDVRRRG